MSARVAVAKAHAGWAARMPRARRGAAAPEGVPAPALRVKEKAAAAGSARRRDIQCHGPQQRAIQAMKDSISAQTRAGWVASPRRRGSSRAMTILVGRKP